MANDLRAQERADATPQPGYVTSPGYVRCPAGMHPEHGDAVGFPPGQLLPEWVAEALAEQRPVPTYDGIYELSYRSGGSREQAEEPDRGRRRQRQKRLSSSSASAAAGWLATRRES